MLKRIAVLFLLLGVAATAQQLQIGKPASIGNVSVLLTKYGDPFSGAVSGVMVSVATTDSTTAAFRVTLRYGDRSLPSCLTMVLPRLMLAGWSNPFSSGGFDIGDTPVLGLTIEPLKPSELLDFTEALAK